MRPTLRRPSWTAILAWAVAVVWTVAAPAQTTRLVVPDVRNAPAAAAAPLAPSAAAPLAPLSPSVDSSLRIRGADEAAANADALETPSFNGVELGTSTIEDVARLWGEPRERSEHNSVLHHSYAQEPFERVEVTFHQGKALSITIQLRQRFAPKQLAEELGLDNLEAAEVVADDGLAIGWVYPERGVAFSFQPVPKEQLVGRILLDRPEPDTFVLRARQRLETSLTGALADVAAALKLAPTHAPALALHARLLHTLGHYEDALAEAQQAARSEPMQATHALLAGEILGALGRIEEAVAVTQQAVAAAEQRPEVKAQAILQLGDLLTLGAERDDKLALEYHMQAIQLAQSLLADPRASVRRVARDVMIDAHLSAANDIAFGGWKMKAGVIPKWLGRAEQTAAQAATESERQAQQWRIAARALAASVGLEGQLNPGPWIDRAAQLGSARVEAAADPLLAKQRKWELGRALYDAMQVSVHRGQFDAALEQGEHAVALLEDGGEDRQLSPLESYMVARLYFRMGSIEAIQHEDHTEAVAWFDRAVEVLERPDAAGIQADLGRAGETLVSMGVSYWATRQQERAIELTQLGAEWMEDAAKAGLIDRHALSVPYRNLAKMHRHQGQAQPAEQFEKLAAEIDAAPVRR